MLGGSMRTAERQPNTMTMGFALRPMQERDIAQSAEIERDAFPALFPTTSFRRELKKNIASYLVAWRRDDAVEDEAPTSTVPDPDREDNDRPIINRLLSNARSLWPRGSSAWETGQQFIAGFLGMWYTVDEVHIVSLGVRREYRGMGIGDLLLIGGIEQAMARRASVVTLEVRVSNFVAKNLYLKFGLKERGIRKNYYTDNREDAIIMTTDPLHAPSASERFQELVLAHERRWGRAERIIS